MAQTKNTVRPGKNTIKVRELITVNDVDTFLTGKGDIDFENGNWKVSVYITTKQVSHSNKLITQATIKRAGTIIEDLVSACMEAEKKIKLGSDLGGIEIPGLDPA